MRVFNNTGCDDTKMLVGLYKHLINTRIKTGDIESVTFNRETFDVFGHNDKFIGTFGYNQSFTVKGRIRWFNESSGEGVIRLNNTDLSVGFYSCNCVGANSLYPELTSNIQFNEGDEVIGEVSSDSYLFEVLGLISIKRAG